MTTLIDSVKRLERAGAESSRASEKLFEAARDVADWITKHAPTGVKLPRGYRISTLRSNIGESHYLRAPVRETEYGPAGGGFLDAKPGKHYLHGDFNAEYHGPTRDEVLRFAADVADGLINEIAELCETRTTEADTAANKLLEAVQQ